MIEKIDKQSRLLHWFLLLMIISLVGNACADFALIWHAITYLGKDQSGKSSDLLKTFYIGQAIGVVLLAPVLSVFIDRYSQRLTSIFLDLLYAASILALIIAHLSIGISPSLLFPFAIVTAALGMIHRSSIGFGALKSLSMELGVTSVVSKFSASLFFTNMIGAVIAGFMYKKLGIVGCLSFAIITFLPMPVIYFKLFAKVPRPANADRNVLREFFEGFQTLIKDKALLWLTISVAIFNLASNIFPALVGIAFQKAYPDRTDIAAIAIAAAIFFGVLSFRPLERVAPAMTVRSIVPLALILPTLLALVCVWSPTPWMFTLAFTFQCAGAALSNIMSGSIRVAKVPGALIGRVNSAYSAVVFLGQILGSLILIPLTERSLSSGAIAIAVCFLCSSIVAFFSLPKTSLKNIIESIR